MGMLEDILKTLERIPAWKRLQALPDRVAALEARVQALENQLHGEPAAQRCAVCGARAMRVTGSAPDRHFGDTGLQADQLECQACGHTETRLRDTFQPPPQP